MLKKPVEWSVLGGGSGVRPRWWRRGSTWVVALRIWGCGGFLFSTFTCKVNGELLRGIRFLFLA
jgi:hypothetical protein